MSLTVVRIGSLSTRDVAEIISICPQLLYSVIHQLCNGQSYASVFCDWVCLRKNNQQQREHICMEMQMCKIQTCFQRYQLNNSKQEQNLTSETVQAG